MLEYAMISLSSWMSALYLGYTVAGAALTVLLVLGILRKPEAGRIFFLCFVFMSLLDSVSALATHLAARSGTLSFGAIALWMPGAALSRLRFAFLVLYAHSFHRYRATLALSIAWSACIGASAVLGLIVYTPLPEIIEAASVLYVAAYLASLLPRPKRPVFLSEDPPLARLFLSCTSFFLIGLLIDLAKNLPQTSPYVSLLLLDFKPLYALVLGFLVSIRLLAARGQASPEPVSPEPVSAGMDPFAVLSPREREVAELIMKGESNRDIAQRLFISESTVKKHVNAIFKKLGVGNRWNLLKLDRWRRGIHP